MYNNIVFDNNTNFVSVNIHWSSSYTLPDGTKRNFHSVLERILRVLKRT